MESKLAEPNDPGQSLAFYRLAARVEALELEVAALSALAHRSAESAPAAWFPPSRPETSPLTAEGTPPPPKPIDEALPPALVPIQRSRLEWKAESAASFPQLPQKSLEDRLGSQVFNLIGIVALIVGAAWALKLAIEQGWIGPTGRVLAGLAAGSCLILWSELFRRKGLAAFSYSLKAVGTGVLYLSLWAAFQLYHLLPAPVALGLMILVTAWNAFLAFTQDAELLAAYALVGGLLTPLLLSTGGDHETFLFTYVAAIDLAIVALLRTKPWPRLLVPANLATVAYFIGYYVTWFHRTADGWDAQSTETALFALVFAALFALVSTRAWKSEEADLPGIIVPVLIPLGNAAFVSLALYSVVQDSSLHASLAWLMTALAAIFLGLMRVQKTSLAAAMHLAAALVFLTVAIPLKANGHSLTAGWLAEGLILYWAACRFEAGNARESRAPLRVLWLLSAGGYTLGLASVLFHWAWELQPYLAEPFFNRHLASALVAVVAVGGAAWLSRPDSASARPAVLIAALSAIDGVALLLTWRAFTGGHPYFAARPAFANAAFATALIGLALLAATTWTAWHSFQSQQERFHLLRPTAACDLILFNLTALLLITHEMGALFNSAEADLKRSLAISAFLMLYGALLLAAGFWRANAFVRWQALVLLLFTIAKVFLYDISGLSAGYRVASFLALGALLLTVSYAYQKDWLALKEAPPAVEDRV